jgi:hypothetical protein
MLTGFYQGFIKNSSSVYKLGSPENLSVPISLTHLPVPINTSTGDASVKVISFYTGYDEILKCDLQILFLPKTVEQTLNISKLGVSIYFSNYGLDTVENNQLTSGVTNGIPTGLNKYLYTNGGSTIRIAKWVV